MNTDKASEKTSQTSNNSLSITSAQTETRSSANRPRPKGPITKLTRPESVLAGLFLVAWLLLFAGGIVMDTTKFRCVISPGGATQLAAEGRPSEGLSRADVCKDVEFWVPSWPTALSAGDARFYKLVISWIGLILFFLPLNLAMVSGAAGAMGALGNRANLEDEDTPITSRDDSNPIMSGLLRGLFEIGRAHV